MFMNKQAGSVKSALALILALTRRAFYTGWGLPKCSEKRALSPRASISGAGIMGTSCYVLRWGQRSRPLSAHLTTPCIAVICIVRWWM